MAKTIPKPKKKFDWNAFLDKRNQIAVHCETENECVTFQRLMHEHGMCWDSGRTYQGYRFGKFGNYKDKTCYSNQGRFCKIDYYNEIGYTILKFSAYDFT